MTILNSKYDETSYDFVESEQGHERALLPPKLIGGRKVLPSRIEKYLLAVRNHSCDLNF